MANFIHQTGTNGFLTGTSSGLALSSTSELASLGSSANFVCSKVLSQATTLSAQYGYVVLTIGSSFLPAAGGNLAGWWMNSIDGGTTYESTAGANLPMARSPDFIIPISTAGANNGSIYYANGPIVPIPYGTFKVVVQNNFGVTMGTSTYINLYPVADTYA